ncbi:MAG: hypothetical protein KF866_12900 [Phycisphaeraceae bacterium]|nr:hypothetical protein [Phycisphaeraceae bacterium]MCW5754154.1 hypothetical protein [Phycisphaeraceae bacterium]
MSLRDRLRRLNHVQQTSGFKLLASVIVAVVAVVLIGWQLLDVARTALDAAGQTDAQVGTGSATDEQSDAIALSERYLLSPEAIEQILQPARDPTTFILGVVMGLGISLAVIWLGMALTAIALFAAGGMVIYPLTLFETTQSGALILAGLLALAASFSVLLQSAKALLGGPGPVMSIARNVLAEATRLRLSVVLLVALGFGMASLPGLLESEMALRYRVQSFLQYGTGASFWVIALLITLFAVSTVAFEQRDKLIWQTMTKPVAPWQYVLGKWLGVVTLAAVLLAVCAAGVFLFTEHLRNQRALGEVAPFKAEYGEISEDRLILESRVLVALASTSPEYMLPGDPEPLRKGSRQFQTWVGEWIQNERRRDADFAKLPNGDDDPEALQKITDSLFSDLTMELRLVPPPQPYPVMLEGGVSYMDWRPYGSRLFRFRGLSHAASRNTPLTLGYKIEAGANNPTHFYRLAFTINRRDTGVLTLRAPQVPVSSRQSLTIPADAVDANGDLYLWVHNYGLVDAPEASEAVIFPPDELVVWYTAGSWRTNFLRAMIILWCKIATLAMVGVALATFLGFQVACLVALVVFLAAEGTGFLAQSLENYATTDQRGNVILFKWVIAAIASVITKLFHVYSELRPTTRLVDGRLLSWGAFTGGLLALSAFAGFMYAFGVVMLRKRELATYSGQ